MDWNFVKVYLAIYKTGSIQEAANKLRMSESTLFRHLNNYEKNMGKFFIRKNGSYDLTKLGLDLLPIAQQIESSFSKIDRQIYARDELGQQTVRITAPTSFSYGYFPKIIDELREHHPSIDIDLLVTNDTLCLNTRQADIAIRVTSSPPEHFIGKQVRKIEWGAYAGYGYLSKNGTPENIEELSKHRIIGGSGTLSKGKAFSWLDSKFRDNVLLRTDDLVAMFYLAEKNHGIALLPDEFNQGNLKRLFTVSEVGTNCLWVLTHTDLREVERVKLVSRYLADSLSKI